MDRLTPRPGHPPPEPDDATVEQRDAVQLLQDRKLRRDRRVVDREEREGGERACRPGNARGLAENRSGVDELGGDEEVRVPRRLLEVRVRVAHDGHHLSQNPLRPLLGIHERRHQLLVIRRHLGPQRPELETQLSELLPVERSRGEDRLMPPPAELEPDRDQRMKVPQRSERRQDDACHAISPAPFVAGEDYRKSCPEPPVVISRAPG